MGKRKCRKVKSNKLKFKDIIEKHNGTPAVICGHGPSLNENKERIEKLQISGNLVRFSVNNWYHYFKSAPDYWVISNSQFSFPIMHEIMNKYKSPVFYSTDGDFSSDKYIQSILECDYLPYDQRHFKGHNCVKIIKQNTKILILKSMVIMVSCGTLLVSGILMVGAVLICMVDVVK